MQRQKARQLRCNRVARDIMEMMHREDTVEHCKAMDRGAMYERLYRNTSLPDDFVMRKKIIEKRQEFIKAACRRLVNLGQLVSKGTRVRIYALPKNRGYL